MNLGCRTVEVITGNCNKRGNEVAWWNKFKIDALGIARQFWEQTHPREADRQADMAAEAGNVG